MKKFSIFSVLVLLVMLVSACGGDSETSGASEDGVLAVGETGLFKTDSGDFEIVLNSIKKEAGGDGEHSLRGSFIVGDITVTSKASKAVNIEKVLPFKIYVDDVVNWNTVTSGKEYSFGTQLGGELKAGESVTGKIIFDARESDKYTVELGGKTNPNKIIWELTGDDVK